MSDIGRLLSAEEWEELRREADLYLNNPQTSGKLSRPDAVKRIWKHFVRPAGGPTIYTHVRKEEKNATSDLNTELFPNFSRKNNQQATAAIVPRIAILTDADLRKLQTVADSASTAQNKAVELEVYREWLKNLALDSESPVYLLYWGKSDSQPKTKQIRAYYTQPAVAANTQPSIDNRYPVLMTYSTTEKVFRALFRELEMSKSLRIVTGHDGLDFSKSENVAAHRESQAAVAVWPAAGNSAGMDAFHTQILLIAALNIPLVLLRPTGATVETLPVQNIFVCDYDPLEFENSLPKIIEYLEALSTKTDDVRQVILNFQSQLYDRPWSQWNTFQLASVKEVLLAATVAMKQINEESLSFDVARSLSFLTKAMPLFHRPNSYVIAFSIDGVSTFWLTEQGLAKEYATPPAGATIVRIWGFSSPFSLLKHKDVLQEHLTMYGERNGAVVVTSLDHYVSFLESLAVHCGLDEAWLNQSIPRNKDWGIVQQEDQACYRATLDKKQYSVDRIKDHEDDWMKIREVVQAIAKKTIDRSPGDLCFDYPISHGQVKLRCARWGRMFNTEGSEDHLKTLLQAAFKSYEPDVYRMLMLSVDERENATSFSPDQVRNAINNAIKRLKEKKQEYDVYLKSGMEEPWIGEVIKRETYESEEVRDLMPRISLPYRYVLLTKFKHREGLENYYIGENHKRARRQFYADLLGLTKENLSDEARKTSLSLEAEVSPGLLRIDFEFCLKPEDLVKRAPEPI